MSHERDAEGRVTFFCDGCDMSVAFSLNQDFVSCKKTLAHDRWTSTKQVGQPWCDWCPGCISVAKEEQRKFEERERERERLKARNARE
jgi:hypothetical protein